MSGANPFGTRALAALIGLGVVLALGFLLLSGFGRIAAPGSETPPPTSTGATGFAGLARLVAALPGGAVKQLGSPRWFDPDADAAVQDPDGLLIVTPTLDTPPKALARLLDARGTLPTLVVLPKWTTQPVPFRRGWVQRIALAPGSTVERLLPRGYAVRITSFGVERADMDPDRTTRWAGAGLAPLPGPERLQAMRSPRLEPLLRSESAIVLGRVPHSRTYLLADPDLLDNHALADPRTARAALRLLAALNPEQPGRIAFDLSLHYQPGERNLIRLMFEPPFLAVTVALLAAALLAGWASAVRFGPVRREAPAVLPGKRALADNIAALTRLAGRSAFGGPAYAQAMRDWIARHHRIPRTLSEAAMGDALDALHPQTRFTELETRLRQARTEAELVAAAQALDDWRKEGTA